MSENRLIVICLDALDAELAQKLAAEGRLPDYAGLMERSARFQLEHGPDGKDRYTGLTWEHFSSGRKPDTSGKWSVISFDPETFEAVQEPATERPFFADLDCKCVVFDAPYFDLQSMQNGVGAVGWSGHDTGVHPMSSPPGLMQEITEKFGPPADVHELNTMVYPSVEQTTEMGRILVEGAKQRVDVATWLLAERCPDWDVAVVGFGEPHDAVELLCHGVLPDHHLANIPSAQAARDGLIAVYEAVSDQIGRLTREFPDATVVAFTMHGMGVNDTDLPTMLLLPEFMYRFCFERPLFSAREDWRATDTPMLKENEDWNAAVIGAMTHPRPGLFENLPERLARKANAITTRAFGERPKPSGAADERAGTASGPKRKSLSVKWMPSVQYARYWPKMDAFAMPAYFDGRIRVNLLGREKHGRVPLSDYKATLDKIEAALRACVDTKTGEPVVREISRPGKGDPLNLHATQADLKILWNGSPVGFRHPDLGVIGPAPIRRAGGHSGGLGALFVAGDGVEPGDYGTFSSFDVAPTIVELLGQVRPNAMDGESLARKARPARPNGGDAARAADRS